ncbi:MAG: hypothetical protein AAGF12_10390 [Myxococcota bacterium]
MTDLSKEARALIDAAVDGDNPTPADRERIKRAVVASVSGGAALTSAATTSAATTSAAASTATTSAVATGLTGGMTSTGVAASGTAAGGLAAGIAGGAVTKLVAVVTVVGAVSTTVAIAPWETSDDAVSAAPSMTEVASSGEPMVAEVAGDSRSAPELPALVEDETSVADVLVGPEAPAPSSERATSSSEVEASMDQPAVTTGVPRPLRTASGPASPPRPPVDDRVARAVPEAQASETLVEAPAESTLAAELALLRRAYQAQRSGSAAAALPILDEHRRLYPTSALRTERQATRVLVLCSLGRHSEAVRYAAVFAASSEGSPIRERIRNSCAGSALD